MFVNLRVLDGSISIHALLAESDLREINTRRSVQIFLSTLSLRRATHHAKKEINPASHFYPRSPCGERRKPKALKSRLCVISIHALLAESDNGLRHRWASF